jgi:Ca2+-binding EF-hand superfamily protein
MLVDAFEVHDEAKDLPITIGEINDLAEAEQIALSEMEWTGLLVKVGNEPNSEVTLERLKDILLEI